jgi:hypothetical protein
MQGKPRLPEMSNFYCLPGRAGGSPNVLAKKEYAMTNHRNTNCLTALPGTRRERQFHPDRPALYHPLQSARRSTVPNDDKAETSLCRDVPRART